MKIYDIVNFGLHSLTQRKLRSWLTVIGIVIGVASIVALISIGQGAQAQIQSQLSGFGADTITISPGFERATTGLRGFGGFGGGGGTRSVGNLTESDIRVVKTTQGILYVNGIVSGRADVAYLGETSSVSVQGVDTSVWRFMQTTKLDSGRYLAPGDENVIVIGNRIATQIFKQQVTINKQLTIEGKTFKVVGILQSTGSFEQQDSAIYMPKENARQILNTNNKKISSISIKVSDVSQVEDIAASIGNKLKITRHANGDKQDFTITTSQAIQNQVSSVTGTFTLFLAAVAGMSLLVGAIGISNTMFTSVLERTRQIGILKSLGATDSEIMKIFITEAGLIGLLGGLLGILFGVAASGFISAFAFTTVITPELIILSVSFSVIIGAVSGFFPARIAARLEPVEALRYE